MVVSELRGEKIDIIPHNDEPARFVAKALSPARVREVLVDDEDKQATVIVPDDQLSLAIGRDGQNARLAARLTGWRVDIKSETEFAQEDEDIEYEGEEAFDGRCMAVLSSGRRCPNAALSGSTYCGLPQHQALARFETNQVAIVAGLSDGDVATLADGEADEAAVAAIVEGAAAEFDEAEAAEEEPEAAEEPEAEGPEAAEAPDAEETEEAEAVEEELEAEAAEDEPSAEEPEDELPAEEALAEDAATEGDETAVEAAADSDGAGEQAETTGKPEAAATSEEA
jgi:N utilization substance protein A